LDEVFYCGGGFVSEGGVFLGEGVFVVFEGEVHEAEEEGKEVEEVSNHHRTNFFMNLDLIDLPQSLQINLTFDHDLQHRFDYFMKLEGR